MHWHHVQHRSSGDRAVSALWNRDTSILCEMALAVVLFGMYVLLILARFSSALTETNAAEDEQTYEAGILQNAVILYSTDHRKLPGNTAIPSERESALSICKEGIIAPDVCISLDEMIPQYIAHIPANETTNMQKHSGYALYLDRHSPRVIAGFAPNIPSERIVQDACLPCPVCTP